MPYKVRKFFHDQGVDHLPGEIVESIDHYPRPESMIRGGWLVWVESGTKPEIAELASTQETIDFTANSAEESQDQAETNSEVPTVPSNEEMNALVRSVVDLSENQPRRRGRPRKVESDQFPKQRGSDDPTVQ